MGGRSGGNTPRQLDAEACTCWGVFLCKRFNADTLRQQTRGAAEGFGYGSTALQNLYSGTPPSGDAIDGRMAAKRELRRFDLTALTIRLRTHDERNAVERLKEATGKTTASRAILRAVHEWPDVVAELAAERRRTAALIERLEALIAAEDDLHRVTITRAEAHKAATSSLEALRTG